jgi:hypothetical protein
VNRRAADYFRWKTNSPSLAVTLILSLGLNSPSSSFIDSGLRMCFRRRPVLRDYGGQDGGQACTAL